MQDDSLIRRAAAQDAAAFEQLMLLHQKAVYNICYRMAGNAEDALDLYFRMCSVNVNTMDLARYGMVLAGNGKDPETGEQLVEGWIVRIVKTLMVTCGLYDESGEFAMKVGIPAKSGVGGGIMGSVEDGRGRVLSGAGRQGKQRGRVPYAGISFASFGTSLFRWKRMSCIIGTVRARRTRADPAGRPAESGKGACRRN